MATRTLILELPEELIAAFGSPEATVSKATEALVIELLRQGAIGQSRAAELLGVTRWAVLDLMGKYGVRDGPRSTEELARDAVVGLSLVNGTLAVAPIGEMGAPLEELLAGVTEQNLHGDVESGPMAGQEAWYVRSGRPSAPRRRRLELPVE